MVILIVEKARPSVRGELSRWLIEPRAGVFVGKVSGMVRDKLWEKVIKANPEGGAILIYSAATEQGFETRIYGDTSRSLRDWEGITLVCKSTARDGTNRSKRISC